MKKKRKGKITEKELLRMKASREKKTKEKKKKIKMNPKRMKESKQERIH